MAAIKLLLGIVCAVIIGSGSMPKRNMLRKLPVGRSDIKLEKRLQLVTLAAQELGVREATGNNDGPRVEQYLAAVALKKGQPWCAAFVCWLYGKAGYSKPLTGWSPALFPSPRLTKSVLPGNVLGIYISKAKRIAHVGLIEKLQGEWCLSIEGNTNLSGSREGDGVYRKRRHLKTIYQVADWVSDEP